MIWNNFGNLKLLLLAVLIMGCSASRISSLSTTGSSTGSINAIALASSGGLLADAVGVELSNRGFTVIDSGATSKMMVRLNLNEIEITKPQGLEKLNKQGIDAFLTVRAAGGYDMQPQSASARMNSTKTGRVLAGISWQNGWGGQAGSIADRTMRKGLAEASKEIAEALVEKIRPN